MSNPDEKKTPVPNVVSASVVNALTASGDTHPVFRVQEPELQVLAKRLAPLLEIAKGHDQRSPLDYLLGALHALFRAKQLGFVDRPGEYTDDYWNGPVTRVRYMGDGDIRTDGKWLAGFYFNGALVRIAAALDRIVVLLEGQTVGWRKPRTPGLRARMEKLNLGKSGAERWEFVFGDGRMSQAFRVYSEVNALKHVPEGVAKGRKAKMDDAVAGVGELIGIVEDRVRLG